MASYACNVLAYSLVFRSPFVEVRKQVEINIPLLAYHIYYMCLKLNQNTPERSVASEGSVSTPERSATSDGIKSKHISFGRTNKKT